MIEFHEIPLRGPSSFTEGERKLIAVYVSGLNHCRYCHAVHTATAELPGVSGPSINGDRRHRYATGSKRVTLVSERLAKGGYLPVFDLMES